MDSLRKKPSIAPRPAEKNERTIPQKRTIYSFPKKEDLYIPREETLIDYTKEKTSRKKKMLHRIIGLTMLAFLALIIGYGTFFAWKAYSVSKKMDTSQKKQTTLIQDVKSVISSVATNKNSYALSGQETGRINILLLGAAGEKKPGGNLTDTIMVMSIDTSNKKVSLLSLPRDLYVQIPDSKNFTKINSLYKISLNEQKNADLIQKAVENITSLKINYYLVVDFDAFEKIVDDIGGINIVSERDIFDNRYPGPNYSYETFSLPKGAHLLDGKTALKYVRQRHGDPEGDFGRAKRQQQVIQAVKSKLFSMQTLFNVVAINNVLNTLGDNIKTNMSFDDIEQFIRLSKTLDTQNINNVVVDAWKPDSLLKVSHVTVGNVQAFILIPRIGNYSEIQELAQNIFNQNEIKNRREQFLKENATIAIENKSGEPLLANKIKKLLSEKLGMKNVRIIPTSSTNSDIIEKTILSSSTMNNKLFTIDELIKKLPARNASPSDAGEPATLGEQSVNSDEDITITLGRDLVETYKYDEDSIDDFNKAEDNQDNIDFTNNH